MNEAGKHRIITEVIEGFDFSKVHKAMKALKWTWGIPGTLGKEKEIPSEKRLICSATKMVTELLNSEYTSTSSGGFCVSKDKDENGPTVILEFVLEVSEVSAHG